MEDKRNLGRRGRNLTRSASLAGAVQVPILFVPVKAQWGSGVDVLSKKNNLLQVCTLNHLPEITCA